MCVYNATYMADSDKKIGIEALGAQMRADWDRRIRHDYRFWMSDGHASDEAMWFSGARDLEILTADIKNPGQKSVLDIGCGVGRLLRSACAKFAEVHGFDVSATAIEKARALLSDAKNLHLHLGDGYTLQPLAAHSIDLVISFAALVSMPTDVVARYMIEAQRVLKDDGLLRMQLYLGKEQIVGRNDTLHIRCYDRGNFERAMQAAGFRVESITELVLPIQVSFKDLGIEAVTVSMRRESVEAQSADRVAALLLPSGEGTATADADLECWMTLNYAHELADHGDFERARETLRYAECLLATVTIDVKDILERITRKLAGHDVAKEAGVSDNKLFERNMEVLRRKFPAAAALVEAAVEDPEASIAETQEGPVVGFRAQCLDHPQKPKGGADAWAKRTLQEKRFKEAARLMVFGFGAGYHVEAFQQISTRPIGVVEPSAAVMRLALTHRDLSGCLEKLEALSIGTELPTHLPEDAELAVRPQHLALFGDFCVKLKAQFYGVRGIASLHPTIGVLGPLQGGTLPITAYTTRALGELKQRIREYDMSGFASGFHQIDRFLYDKYRVAAVHGYYIEMLSHVVREAINEKPVDVLICMAQAPFSGPVLTELRKRGIITVLWFMEDYLRFTYWKDVARYFDFVFTIQKGECIEVIKAAGAGEVHYLPAACDPFIHVPMKLEADDQKRWGSPFSFVGAGYHNRQQMFAALADEPFKIWGTEWPGCRPFDKLVQEEGRRLTPAEYVKIFNATEVNLNLHSSTERDGVEPNGDFVNPRTFELAAAGAFQLVDERTLLPELFIPGKEVITFKDTRELKEKMHYYLAHPEERLKVCTAARERAIREHTYVHRLREMLSIIYNSKYEQLKRKEENSPWSMMLGRAKPHPELLRRCEEAFKHGEEPALDGLVAHIINGTGKLTETEQKLLFLYHVRKQIVRMKIEELGSKAPEEARRGGL